MIYFLFAGALALLWAAVHIVIGGRQIARPLAQSTTLAPVVRDTQHLCWHLTSGALVLMGGFLMAAALTGTDAYGVAGTLLSATFAAIGLGLAPLIGQDYRVLPQGWLFVPVTGLGLAGLLL